MVDLLARARARKKVVDIGGHAPNPRAVKGNNSSRIVINQSRVKAWRECHRRHYYRYEEQIVRLKTKRPLVFGKAAHDIIEAYANGDDPMERLEEIASKNRKMFKKEIEEYGDIVADLGYIMRGYFDYWDGHPDQMRYIRFNKKASEHTFEIELRPGLVWKGTVDAYAKAKGLKWLAEHKTFKREWSEDERWRNLQSATYRRATKLMGWPETDGMLWDYIHSKAPTRPQLTAKTGKISTRAIVTLPEVADAFLKENNIKRKSPDALALIESAEASLPRYYKRVFTPANDEVEDKIFEDFMETALEIAEDHDRKKSRNIGKHCGWCDYENICRTELTGGDIDWVMKREYGPETNEHKSKSQDRVEEN